jgi:hypothetical protein
VSPEGQFFIIRGHQEDEAQDKAAPKTASGNSKLLEAVLFVAAIPRRIIVHTYRNYFIRQRPPKDVGAFGRLLGGFLHTPENLSFRQNAWWSWKDSNCVPGTQSLSNRSLARSNAAHAQSGT